MENVIEIHGLTKKFGNFTAVDNISFNVRKGEIFGFLGANGAGKTTAMRILCGLSVPTSGGGTVAGYDIVREPEKIKRHIGYMSQKFSLYSDLKVWENIRLFGGIYGLSDKQIASRTEDILSGLGMEDLALVTRSPCISGTSQTSSLAGTPPGLDQDADEDYDDEDGHHRGDDPEDLDLIREGGDDERHRDEDERQGDCCIHQRAFDHDP